MAFLGIQSTIKCLQMVTAKKMKFSIVEDFFSKCGQICSFLRIWSHLLKKSSVENFIFCTDDVIKPAELPPPEQALCYHGFRVHFQIIQWKMLDRPGQIARPMPIGHAKPLRRARF